MGNKCLDCKILYPYPVMEFHHLNPSKKDLSWQKLKHLNEDLIKLELNKCVLLCANCHRLRHYNEKNKLKQNNHNIKILNYCLDCNIPINKKSKRCKDCHKIRKKQINLQKKVITLCECGKKIKNTSKNCKSCNFAIFKNLPKKSKINWPNREELQKLVWEQPTIHLAKQLGVSDNAINKKCKLWNIPKPPIGHWLKKQKQ